MPTVDVTAPKNDWTKVADQVENVLITSRSSLTVMAHVGTEKPANGAAYHDVNSDMPFSMSGIGEQSVWISSGGQNPITVSVTAV